MEINFNHGDPLELADQAFLFKRTLRQAALKHGIYATFMAKPMEREPGSAMHIHQSVFDVATGDNLFAAADGEHHRRCSCSYIAGLQKYLPAAMPLLAPNVNSYRRLRRYSDAPINLHWGWENRTVGLRVPDSQRAARRVENRVAGRRRQPLSGDRRLARLRPARHARRARADQADRGQRLPPGPDPAAPPAPTRSTCCAARKPLRQLLGDEFVEALIMVKEVEHEAYQRVISSWEREHLLLNV